MPSYKLNYIYINQQNRKTFGIIYPSESEAKNIESVKQMVLSSKNSAALLSIKAFELSSVFYLNLIMVDSKFPEILEAAISLTQDHNSLTSVELCGELKRLDPLCLGRDYEHTIYNHKWKQFLLALGSGLNESEIWTNKFKGIEHHAIFKQTEGGLTPDFFYPAPFAEYLFLNTVAQWSDGGFKIQLF